jgi:hypothetical protein
LLERVPDALRTAAISRGLFGVHMTLRDAFTLENLSRVDHGRNVGGPAGLVQHGEARTREGSGFGAASRLAEYGSSVCAANLSV